MKYLISYLTEKLFLRIFILPFCFLPFPHRSFMFITFFHIISILNENAERKQHVFRARVWGGIISIECFSRYPGLGPTRACAGLLNQLSIFLVVSKNPSQSEALCNFQ